MLEPFGLSAQEALVAVQPDKTVLIPMHNYHGATVNLDAGTPLGMARPVLSDDVVLVEERVVLCDDVFRIGAVKTAPAELPETSSMHPPCADCFQKIRESLNLDDQALTNEERAKLDDLLEEFSDIFALDDSELGCTNVVQHTIDTGNHSPIKQRPYRTPISRQEKISEMINNMREQGVIQPS